MVKSLESAFSKISIVVYTVWNCIIVLSSFLYRESLCSLFETNPVGVKVLGLTLTPVGLCTAVCKLTVADVRPKTHCALGIYLCQVYFCVLRSRDVCTENASRILIMCELVCNRRFLDASQKSVKDCRRFYENSGWKIQSTFFWAFDSFSPDTP